MDLYLVAFTVVLKATGTFAVTTFTMLPRYDITSTTFTYQHTYTHNKHINPHAHLITLTMVG